jgi:undecaprenyl-diphosphatase
MINIISSFDHSLLTLFVAHRTDSVAIFFFQVTQLGSVLAICAVGTAIALILALRHRISEMTGLIVTLGGTALASSTIKVLVARSRPDTFYAVYQETGYSFPSEHTALATSLCIFIVYLVFRLTRSRAWRATAFCIAFVIIISVALSRLYLGVHYPSDVIGGILIGTLMASIGIMTERSFERIRS